MIKTACKGFDAIEEICKKNENYKTLITKLTERMDSINVEMMEKEEGRDLVS